MSTASLAPGTFLVLNAAFVLAFAALAVRVSNVLLVMEATVPIFVMPSVRYKSAPTANSVVNDVPEPVTVAELVVVVMVPVKVPDNQVSFAFQLPVALDVRVTWACSIVLANAKSTNALASTMVNRFMLPPFEKWLFELFVSSLSVSVNQSPNRLALWPMD
jgi:hypothetical protein